MLCSCTCLFCFPEHKSKASSSSKEKTKNKNRSELGSLLLQVNLRPLFLEELEQDCLREQCLMLQIKLPKMESVMIGSIRHALIKLRPSQPSKELKLF